MSISDWITHPGSIFGYGWLAGILSKLLQTKIRSRFNRDEKIDSSVCDLLSAYQDSLGQHYAAWVDHQKGKWKSVNGSRDKIEELAKKVRIERELLMAGLKPHVADEVKHKWGIYFSELSGDAGLISAKASRISNSKELDEVFKTHLKYLSALRRRILGGGVSS